MTFETGNFINGTRLQMSALCRAYIRSHKLRDKLWSGQSLIQFRLPIDLRVIRHHKL